MYKNPDISPLADDIYEIRRKHNLTQREFAARLGCSVNFVCMVERGKAKPSIKFLNAIGDEFGYLVRLVKI